MVVSQIVAGLDDPYPLGEMDGITDGYPGKVIDEVVESGVITASDRKEFGMIMCLGGLGNEK